MTSDIHSNDDKNKNDKPHDDHGPPYEVNIEGVIHPWTGPTITTEDLARLGGWDINQGVIEIDKDNVERTLRPGEIIEIKPGHGFGRKVRFKRGSAPADRMKVELELLRTRFPDAELDPSSSWVRIPIYRTGDGWNHESVAVAFQATAYLGGGQPYAFCAQAGLRFRGAVPSNYTEPANVAVPFAGTWGVFSWAPDAGWQPTADPRKGTNLLTWALSFAKRFAEGA